MSRVLLIGFGVEGRAAARHFLARGDEIIAADKSASDRPCPEEFAKSEAFHWMTETEAAKSLAASDLVLRSPGIPPIHDLVKAALAAGKNVTTPTGYWLAHLAPANTITVTGSKGKSTTVTLIVGLLGAMGRNAAPHGNIGLPPLDSVPATADYPVLELSSYMLHDVPDGPYTHLVTNLFREHTPWHGSEENYHAAKLRPFFFTPPRPGLSTAEIIKRYGLPEEVEATEEYAQITDDHLIIGDRHIAITELPPAFRAGPNLIALRNAVAMVRKVTAAPIPTDAVLATAENFRSLPSRQEHVQSTDGRDWINDALATVPEAVLHALTRFADRDITLLLGGADREQNFTALAGEISRMPRVTPLIFGSTAGRLEDALTTQKSGFTACESFEAAIETAAKITPPGGVILFSPAAASEPPHDNYTVRARIFTEAAASA
ncbi:UDP-N-acetylmuramoyl-L-alanine--D-glutamate ligase [Parvularcula marina]|uniref:UDP-N-acetylmuramoyl-L-alanine--D-glutamate ligase n=1 Tax=Parvularcula marina TaxID=2292771 RepID=UPI003511F0DB